ncbi:uncharacterized protein [Cicer arietinum]|uniref:uncharacterized protein n=1 Tax=Cicer arietinum TaxID=3827 RepID=UPI003CC6C766
MDDPLRPELYKFEVSLALFRELKEIHFSGKHNEDTNRHLTNFFELCETLKVGGCSNKESNILRLFPLSLKNDAKEQLNSFHVSSITTWDDLEENFLEQYFPQLCSLERGKRFLVTNRKRENLFVTLIGGSRTALEAHKIIEIMASNEQMRLYNIGGGSTSGILELNVMDVGLDPGRPLSK